MHVYTSIYKRMCVRVFVCVCVIFFQHLCVCVLYNLCEEGDKRSSCALTAPSFILDNKYPMKYL